MRPLHVVCAALAALAAAAPGLAQDAPDQAPAPKTAPSPAPAAPAPAPAADLPADIQHLAPYLANREDFVTELRRHDKAEQQQISNLLRQADKMKAEGKEPEEQTLRADAKARVDRLRASYEASLKYFSDSARLHNFYGELLYDRYEDTPGALKEWNLAIAMDSKLGDGYNNIALHQFHTGNYAEGLRNLDAALELEPGNPDFLFNMVQVYLVHGPQMQTLRGWATKAQVYDEAMKLSRKAIKAAPDDYSLLRDYALNYWTAENMGATPDWRAAAAACAAARAKAPNNVETFWCWMQEGRAHLADGNHRKARPAFEEALEIMPNNPTAQQLLEESKTKSKTKSKPKTRKR